MTPSFRRDLNVGTTWSLPAWSTGPAGDEQAALEAAVAAGYQGVQGANPRRCRDLGLVPTTFAIQREPGGLVEQARRWSDLGFVCCTVLLGTGFEDDASADRLADEVLEATTTSGVPVYVETHRGTATQDIWRTLRLVERHPDLRFNADLSHWYTGHELGMADVPAVVELLAPVLDRVRYVHGRIGTSGSIQIDVGDGDPDAHPSVAHFQLLWSRAMAGFIAGAADDPVPLRDLALGFAPELLPSEVGYARLVPGADASMQEEGDRWAQALVLTDIASACFADAAGGAT